MAAARPLRVLGYTRRSTGKQGISIEVQKSALECARDFEGWDMELRNEDIASGGSMNGRPVLAAALADLKAGRADVLAVAKLERLSRDVADFSALLNTAARQNWHVICLDLGVDTRPMMGRAMAQMAAVFAELERRRIGERTSEGMARIKATTGRHMGRPSLIPAGVEERIFQLADEGMSASAIARLFNNEHVPKGQGSTPLWNHSHVLAAFRRVQARRKATEPHNPATSSDVASNTNPYR